MQVRYVGKTGKLRSRYLVHISPSDFIKKGTYRRHWIRSLMIQDIRPVLVILEETDKILWEKREIYWINFLRSLGHKLTNISMGGNGGAGHEIM